MGMILESSDGLHAEARRYSFVVYTDRGERRLELPWRCLTDLAILVDRLAAYHDETGVVPHPPESQPCDQETSP